MRSRATHEQENRAITRITLIGAVLNLFLSGAKILVGFLSGSQALVADGVHSISDLISDGIVLVGAYLGNLPPDESLPYGYGKFETFAALMIASGLVGVGAVIAISSGMSMYNHEVFHAGPAVLITAIVSIVVKEGLYQVTRAVGKKTRSPAVIANAWHHRSDAFSSVAVMIGAIAGLLGWDHGDQVAGILVGLMVAASGVQIGFGAVMDLAEASVDKDSLTLIRECLDSYEQVLGWHRLRTRKVGREVFIDVHVLLDPAMSVQEGHDIVDMLQDKIEGKLTTPANFTVHMEPYCEAQLQEEERYRASRMKGRARS